jgi:hypothetical protein
MRITKRQLKRIIKEYHPRPDDDGYPDDDEDDVAYDQGYDDGFNGYPSNPVVGGDYHAGYEEGVNAAKDEDSRAEDAEEFGPHSPGMMGPPRREGKMKITKRQLGRIIKEAQSTFDGHPSPVDGKTYSGKPVHMSGRNQGPMEQLHTAIDALIEALGNEGARQELLGIVEEWSDDAGQYNEGTSPQQMPNTWHQVLGNCLKEKR